MLGEQPHALVHGYVYMYSKPRCQAQAYDPKTFISQIYKPQINTR
jgi:hypothetical protein